MSITAVLSFMNPSRKSLNLRVPLGIPSREGHYLSLVKSSYRRPTANITLSGEALNPCPNQEQGYGVHSNCFCSTWNCRPVS